MSKPMSVDPAVYDLALRFLREVKGVTDEDRQEVAEEILLTIEDFISSLEEDEA